MVFHQVSGGFLVVFAKGEKLISGLGEFAKTNGIKGAWLSGLGAVSEAEVGYYHLDKKEYEFKQLNQVLEIVSLNGNLTELEGEPMVHTHIVLSDEKMNTHGGHLKEATVGGTCEIYVSNFDTTIKRQFDSGTGLKLIV